MKVALLLAIWLWQAPVEEPKQPVVEGRVVEPGSGVAVAKAVVTLARMGSAEMNPPKVETDAEGAFVAENLKPGSYLVLAEKAGYSRRAYGAKNDGALRGVPVRLEMNERRKLVIELPKQGIVTGKVTDAEGEAMQGVVVFGMRPAYQRGKKSWAPVGVGQMPSMSSDTGEYRLTGLPAGQFRICAMPMSVITGAGLTAAPAKKGPSGKTESVVVTCYPNEPEVERGAPVEVRDGMEVPGIEIRLARRVVATVKGQVTGLPDEVPQMLALSLSRPGAGTAGMMFSNRAISTGGEGKFEFRNVQPGQYVLHTLPMGLGAVSLGLKVALEVTDDEVQEVLAPALMPFTVEGRVRVEGRTEAPALGGAQVVLTADDDIYQSVPMGPVREGGLFRLAGVTADRYRVAMTGLPEGLYLKSAQVGSKSWDEGVVELGAAGQGLTLILAEDAATVSGTVRDERGEPAGGAFVVLLDPAQRHGRSHTVRATEDGVYRITGVEPGEYRLFAAGDVDSGGVDDAEYVKPWLSRAVSLKVGAKERPSSDLKLQ